MITLKVKKLTPEAIMPVYATEGAACFDLHACLPDTVFDDDEEMYYCGGVCDGSCNNDCCVETDIDNRPWFVSPALRCAIVPTGLAVEVPEGHVMLIFSRSGHGFNKGVRLANCVGVIDSDYRGEVKVALRADDSFELPINHGDRIAQAMILPFPKVSFEEVTELSDTERGQGGFGSTGK